MTKQTEAMKLALEALESWQDTYPQSWDKYDEEAITAMREALAEQPAQQCKWPTCQSEEYQQVLAEQIEHELVGEQPAQQEPDYAWSTVADYERDAGFETNQAFRMGWDMARTTNGLIKQLAGADQ